MSEENGRDKRTKELLKLSRKDLIGLASKMGLRNAGFKYKDKEHPGKSKIRRSEDVADMIYFKELDS